MGSSINVWAQGKDGRNDWHQKMKAEKIAFLTSEMNLTPAEAQVFWPVYNQAEAEKKSTMKSVRDAYCALMQADKDGKNGKEMSKLLKAYLDASSKTQTIDLKYVKEYEKLLPAEKVAKLFIAEENFRRMQIQKLKAHKPEPKK